MVDDIGCQIFLPNRRKYFLTSNGTFDLSILFHISRMAIILHGDGLCTGHHNHSHGHHSHGHKHHSHNHKHTDESCRNNNKPSTTTAAAAAAAASGDPNDMKYKILHNFNSEDGLPQTIIVNAHNALGRTNSICSYRSPSHSRTNSFSRVIPINDAAARRASYTNHTSKLKSITVTMHRDSIDSEITRYVLHNIMLRHR